MALVFFELQKFIKTIKMSGSDDWPMKSDMSNHSHQESSSLTPLSGDEDDDDQQQQQWAERFEMPLFLLTQFNVHYLSWLKYPAYLMEYLDRFNRITELVQQLPEFTAGSSSSSSSGRKMETAERQQILSWLAERSTTDCFNYKRQLLLSMPKVFGNIGEMKIRLALFEANSGTLPVVTGSVKVKENEANADAAPVIEEEEGLEPNRGSTEEKESGEEEESQLDNSADHLVTDSEFYNWGSIKICTEFQHVFSFPKNINFKTQKHFYLKLALRDTDSPTPDREPFSIYIHEAMISGYSGFTKNFHVKINDKKKDKEKENKEENAEEKDNEETVEGNEDAKLLISSEESEKVPELKKEFGFELSLKWQIESGCFAKLVANPVAILRKLSGTLFLMGEYYWKFYRDFYRWAALESDDANVRYAAIQEFHQISLLLSPEALFKEMKDIFVHMCLFGAYPLPDQLSHHSLSTETYVSEPVSLLDNLITIFSCLSTDEQTEAVRRLVPFAGALLRVRPLFLTRLASLLSQCLANYDGCALESVIMPLATTLLLEVTTLEDPQAELVDPRGAKQSWEEVNKLAALFTTLIVECVQCARPPSWSSLPIDHPEMATTANLLEQIMKALFTPNRVCIDLLNGIYKRLRQKVLLDEHLNVLLTADRIKQYRKWKL